LGQMLMGMSMSPAIPLRRIFLSNPPYRII
jgi:hypothetical protein